MPLLTVQALETSKDLSLWGQKAGEGFSRRFHKAVLGTQRPWGPQTYDVIVPSKPILLPKQIQSAGSLVYLPLEKNEMYILYYFSKASVKGLLRATRFLCVILFHSLGDHVR